MDIDIMKNAISNYIHATKYAKYIPELKRRETFNETVDRVVSMHVKKYPNCINEINDAFKFVYNKQILPSMRSMQFAGNPILKHNARMYNCSFTLVDRPKVFSEIMYLLLCGCGVGFSVQRQHVSKLPPLKIMDTGLVNHHLVGDSIEGWSNAVDALINGAINGYYVEFAYNAIRPEGSYVSSRGTAPGHIGLKESLEKVRSVLLNAQGRKLTPLECHDIICHIANSVIVGGIRYSSLISIFSKDDMEMMNCKNTENFEFGGKNKHRALANNSVAVTRHGDYTIISKTIELNKKNFGDPGFVFLDDFNYGVNPCLTSDTLILDDNRLLPINCGKAKTWNSWKTGEKETIELVCNNGIRIKCTPDHKVMLEDGTFIEAINTIGKNLKFGLGNRHATSKLHQWITAGILFGNGFVSNNEINVKFNKYIKNDVFNLLINAGLHSIESNDLYINKKELEDKTGINFDFLNYEVSNRLIPEYIMTENSDIVASFLHGLFKINGIISNNQISLIIPNFKLCQQIQILLASFGIISWIKQSEIAYSVQIEPFDINKFEEKIGFCGEYNEKPNINNYKNKLTVISINNIGIQEVWDYRMNVPPHYNFCNGLIAKNCGEIVINPKDSNGNTGFGFCNLVDINVAECKNGLEFLEACKAAAIIATLQAGYDSFPYLGKVTESIVKSNPLIGVSITGMMDSPWIFNENLLRSGAKLVMDWNEYMANKIHINKSPRCTCIKPSGSGSLELGCIASGIHPHHASKYFRRILAKSNDIITSEFAKINPHMVSDLGNGNLCITFPVSTDGITLQNLKMEDFLNYIMLVYRSWILGGVRRGEKIHHNISCTVSVANDKWDEVNEFVWKNRSIIGGITFFPEGSDDIPNCPRQAVKTQEQIEVFNNLLSKYTDIDYSKIYEQDDNTNVYVACESDKCNILQHDNVSSKFGRVFIGKPSANEFIVDGHKFVVSDIHDGYFIAKVINNQ